MKRYSNDPYWTTAKFNSIDIDGNPVKKGDPIFYYPRTKVVMTGEKAECASAEFEANAMDEALYNGESW